MSLALDEYIQRTVDSGLLSGEELREFVAQLPSQRLPKDGESLARQLVQAQKLTAYQASVIYQGSGKRLVLGKYVILSRLGRGGMGVVYKAMHRTMHRLVAIKVLASSAKAIPGAVARFQREVRAFGLLDHPNVVTAYDADEIDGHAFLVMRYVDGPDLATLVEERGVLTVPMAISCIIQAARGLEYAHGHGLVHRDVKPKNLLLDRDGTVKLLDLGLVRFERVEVPQGGEQITETGHLLGSIDYMAPEQAADMRTSDARSDIYGLGCTLYYLLTGAPPYQGESRVRRLVAHWEQPIPSLRAACPEASEALERVFHKMVAKNPSDRYQSAAEVITDLERCQIAEVAAELPSVHVQEARELSEFFEMLAGNRPPRERPSDTQAVTPDQSPTVRIDTLSMQAGDSKPIVERKAEAKPRRAEVKPRQRKGPRLPVSRRRIAMLAGALVASVAVIAVLVSLLDDGGSDRPKPPPGSEAPTQPRQMPRYKVGWPVQFQNGDLRGWKSSGEWKFDANQLEGKSTQADAWLLSERTFGDVQFMVRFRIPEGGGLEIAMGATQAGKLPPAVLRLVDEKGPALARPKGNGAPQLVGVPSGSEIWNQVVVRREGASIEAALIKGDSDAKEEWLTEEKPIALPKPVPAQKPDGTAPQVRIGLKLVGASGTSIAVELFCVDESEHTAGLPVPTGRVKVN